MADTDKNKAPLAHHDETLPSVEVSSTGRPLTRNWIKVIAFIWCGQAVSILTSYAALFAVIWYIVSVTGGSVTTLATVSTLTLLPIGFISPFAGVLADRVNRRLIMIVADAGVGVVSVALALIIMLGSPSLTLVVGVLILRSCGQAFHAPAMTAAMPMLVPARHLLRINTLSQMLWSFAGIFAPAVGIFIYINLGLEFALLLDALGAAVAVAGMVLARIPTVRDKTISSRRVVSNMADGLRVISKNRGLMLLIVLCTIDMILFTPISTLFPLMTYSHFGPAFGNDEEVLGYLASLIEAVFGIVILAGSLILILWGGGRRHTLIVINCGLGIGVTTLVMGLLAPGQFWVFLGASGVMAAFCAFYNGPVTTILQRHSPNEKTGRVMGVYSSMVTLAPALGLLPAALIAEPFGIANWFLLSGILMVALVVPAYFLRSIRGLDKS
ncbi:MAG: MFS transporter [Coriobacteriales bacterium]|jgi:DHA3 family macrolide efflux protein-like MFS transporter|nr:MFS transporter [Coriobacteriales bacterium]